MQIGPFRVLASIARGGGGQVYRVANPQPGGPDLALKLLLGKPGPRSYRRYQTEVQAMLRLRHPGVVGLHAAGEHGDLPYLVMDLVEGASLQDRLQRRGALPWRESAELALQVAEALAECHALGVVHRDLKPDNMLVDADGRARVADFGLALDLDASQSRLTQSGTFMGTPGYWAPEQASGKTELLGPLVDVYGIGAVLYAMLTRMPPFRPSSVREAISQTISMPPDPPSVHAPDVPKALERICMRCLEKDPAQRYPSAQGLSVALRELLHGPPPDSAPPRRAPWGAAVAIGAALALGLGAWWLTRGEAPDPVAGPGPAEPAVPAEPSEPKPDLDALLAAQDWESALPLLDLALAADPRDVELRVQRGRARRGLGEFALALEDLGEVLATHPDHREALHHRGAVLRKLKREADALVDLERLLALDPTHAGGHYHRGVIRRRAGQLQGAIEDFDDALRLDPDLESVARYHRARAYLELGELGLALEDVQRVLALAPQDVGALYQRSQIRIAQGELAEALPDLDLLVELQPEVGSARIDRGLLRIKLGQREEGRADLRRGLELDPGAENADLARQELVGG